jgi:Tol biopolymer transport system component
MALTVGTRLGAYEIAASIGAGGMGEVYRATDTKLKRQVAIKVLPTLLAADPERLARFEREAEVLARLNHPNIAQIHGVEDSSDVKALVMELVEGPTLADRLAHGSISLDEAVPIARQIAAALETAHELGIVHRDLKPANIKLRPDGTVKVLDFGLAKAMDPIGLMSPGHSIAPTITTPAMTHAGVILGTAAYMSPEQAAGKATDRRADIFSFGAVLYEMLTARRAFDGDSVSETLASVLKVDPDWKAFPASTPAAVRRLIQRCVTKDRTERLQAIGEARIALEHPSVEETATAVSAPRRQKAWAVAAVASTVLLLAALALLAYQYATRIADPAPAMRLSVLLPGGWELSIANRQGVPTSLVMSPNGRILAMVARRGDGADTILIRRIDSPAAQPLAGTEGVSSMFWSPDSRLLGFFVNGKLMKIDVAGGPPTTVCDVPGNVAGGTWNQEGTIVYSAASTANYVLWKVPAGGGTATTVWPENAKDAGVSKIRPSFLPDGRHFLYAAATGVVSAPSIAIEAGSLDSTEHIHVIDSGSTNAQYAQGHLLYLRDSTLMAQPFDLKQLATRGDALPVAEQIQRQGVQVPYGLFSASAGGALVYQTGTNAGSNGTEQLTWVDRTGATLGTVGEPDNYTSVALSPDATRAVVSQIFPIADLWTVDLARGVKTRLTFGSSLTALPVWSPDGRQVAFGSVRNGTMEIYVKAANGTGGEEALMSPGQQRAPADWSPDGRYLLFGQRGASGPTAVMARPMRGDQKPFVVLSGSIGITPVPLTTFSPDGRWIAYSSEESGRSEVYVARFTAPGSQAGASATTGERVRVSPGGGGLAKWRRDGRELYYLTLPPQPTLMAATVNAEDAAFTVNAVTPLFRVTPPTTSIAGWFWDVAPDGKRFLVIKPVQVEIQAAPAPPTIVINWLPPSRP